jgi:hypothetical protein
MTRPSACFFGALLALYLAPRAAAAQVNSDLGLSGGVMKRITTGSEATDPGFGPTAQLQGHVAVLPMLRVGLYAAWDMSPMPSYGVRNFYEGGIHVKLTPPLLSAPWKMYLFAGFGAGYVHQDGYSQTGALAKDGTFPAVQYSSTDGVILEIPAGLGLAYQLGPPSGGRGRHWELFVEAGGRFGVGFIGRIYDQDNNATAYEPKAQGPTTLTGNFTGQDSFALSLSAGVSWSN